MEVLFEKLERKLNALLVQREDLIKQVTLLRQENEQLRQSYHDIATKIQGFEERLFKVVDAVPASEKGEQFGTQREEEASETAASE